MELYIACMIKTHAFDTSTHQCRVPSRLFSALRQQLRRQIKTIKVSGRGFELDRQDSLQALSRVGPQLTDFELSHCFGVSSKALGTLLQGFGRQLISLDLSGCLDMGDK